MGSEGPGISPDHQWGQADLHIHSAVGDGAASVLRILEYVEHCTDLDLIAITDHDEIAGAYESRDLAARNHYRFEVVVGTEVSTLDGHLLALYVEKPIRMLQSMEKTISAVHEQGGLCIIPHPMSWLAFSAGRRVMTRVLNNPRSDIYFDGVETFNPSVAGRVAHLRVQRLNHTVFGLAETGGSDSHQLSQIGSAHTLFPGKTGADFRLALQQRTTRAVGQFWTANQHLEGLAGQQFRTLIHYPRQHLRNMLQHIRGLEEGP